MNAPTALPPARTRVGVDVVDVDRFRRVVRRRPAIVERLFTSTERNRLTAVRDPAPNLAARFAVKEAVRKALGRAVAWHACETATVDSGAPVLRLVPGTETSDGLAVKTASVSIAHDGPVAMAVVVLEVE